MYIQAIIQGNDPPIINTMGVARGSVIPSLQDGEDPTVAISYDSGPSACMIPFVNTHGGAMGYDISALQAGEGILKEYFTTMI